MKSKLFKCFLGILYGIALFMGVGMGVGGFKVDFGTQKGAMEMMASSLIFIWVFLGGIIMFLLRKKVSAWIQSISLSWKTKFIIFSSILALTEEAITTTLTNLSPKFGYEGAFITASTNYLEVIVYHSVIVIVPMFFVWARILAKYNFSPQATFFLFGLTGVVAEFFIGGPGAIVMAPFWIFVYGLMIFLPRMSIPEERGAKDPRFWNYITALILPVLASIAMAIVVNVLAPHLPHFGNTFIIG